MMRTAVIILNYKTWEETLKEISAVREIIREDDRIIVVDNASPNESSAQLSKWAEKLDYVFLQSESNRGYAAGNNIGLKYAYDQGFQYGWVLNNDIEMDDPAIMDKLIRAMQSDRTIGVVSPDILAPNGHLYNRDSKRYSFYDLTIGRLTYPRRGRILEDRGGYGYVYRPQGCCMLLDLDKANRVNYMDEYTFLYSEEIIYAERLLKKGYMVACCTDASVIHNHSVTVKSTFQKRQIWKIRMESFTYYLKEYRNFGFIGVKICQAFQILKYLIVG